MSNSNSYNNRNRKIVVLDDDPTGTQTVHDIPVYTNWELSSLKDGFTSDCSIFYILTNSRSFTVAQTIKAHTEIAENLAKAAIQTGICFTLISRGDSTLRGHYPLETKVLCDTLAVCGMPQIDGEIFVPFFAEGGRITRNDIHFVISDDREIPAGKTEFAKDETFGYHNSNLKRYLQEKSNGEIHAEDIISIFPSYTSQQCAKLLLECHDHRFMIVNAEKNEDLIPFCKALHQVLQEGRHFMIRSAASFIKIFAGISSRPLLTGNDIIQTGNTHGGLIVVGSHTEKTTRQLTQLHSLPEIEFREVNTDLILNPIEMNKEIETSTMWAQEKINHGITACLSTKRKLFIVAGDSKEQALRRSTAISQAMVKIVKNLSSEPSFVLAKGGITSSDIAVKALGIHKAYVLGQIEPGVSVWKADAQSRFPKTPYIIFPGNVGNDNTVKEAAEKLMSVLAKNNI